jgi:hypothetical protein
MGTGLPVDWDIARFLLHDFGHAITLADQWHLFDRCEPGEGGGYAEVNA